MCFWKTFIRGVGDEKGMIGEDKLDPAVFRSLETLVFFLCHTNLQLLWPKSFHISKLNLHNDLQSYCVIKKLQLME